MFAHVHHHDHAEIVVRANRGVDRHQHRQPDQLRIDGRLEHVELAEESRRDRHSQQGKQEQSHCRGGKRLPCAQTREVVQRQVPLALSADLRNNRERADLHQRITQEVKQHGRIRRRRSGFRIQLHRRHCRKRYQRVARMRDRAIRQHALHVGLHQCAQVANEHRDHRENPERPEPEIRGRMNRGENPQQQRKRCRLWSRGEKRRNRRGRAFVNVRRPHLKGSSRHLEAQANQDQSQSKPQQVARGIRRSDLRQVRRARGAINQRNAV